MHWVTNCHVLLELTYFFLPIFFESSEMFWMLVIIISPEKFKIRYFDFKGVVIERFSLDLKENGLGHFRPQVIFSYFPEIIT